jgi:Zn-dependent M28 family amino/carboxypeptidase
MPTQVNPQVWLVGNLDRVSADRMMADVRALAAIPTRHVNSPGIAVAADYIAAALADSVVEARLDEFPLDFHQIAATPANVVGVIPGSDPEAGAILLGAHYDSRTADIDDWLGLAPGANDNATGVAVLMEVARLFSSYQPRATVHLVAFAAEETGLQGSRHFVESGAAEEVRAMIAFDIVGNSSGPSGSNALRVFSAGPEGSPSRQLARWLADLGAVWTPDVPVLVQDALDRPGRYSDHVPFTEAGIPSVRFIEAGEHTEWQHNSLDTVDRVDPAFLRRVAQLALAAAVELAENPEAFR